MTSQRPRLGYVILAGTCAAAIALILAYSDGSCGLRHVAITDQLARYGLSPDPEMCEVMVDRIDSFNESCEPRIEIMDCG